VTYRDQALVLRKLDYGEADRIYTLLTQSRGKVGAIARGVRRSASKLAGDLELFSRVDVELARGRNLDVITQVVRLPGPRIEADLGRTAYAALVAELADRVCEDRHPAEELYRLAAGALSHLAQDPTPRLASAWFCARALAVLGYSPQLMNCASCYQILPPAPAPFAPEVGGLLCPCCTRPGMMLVAVPVIKVLRVMAAGDIALYQRLRLDEGMLVQTEMVLEAQLEHHLDRQLKSLRFLRQMRATC
jgi:DNA repair protein RecO (recombination protein O)